MPSVTRSSKRHPKPGLSSNWTGKRRRMLLARFNAVPYPNWLGMQVDKLTAGHAELSLGIKKHHQQYQGIAHGGVLASLADTAATFAALTVIPDNTDVVTIEFKVNFLNSAPSGRLFAKGDTVRVGSRVAVSDVAVYGPEPDRLVLTGTFTMLVFPNRKSVS